MTRVRLAVDVNETVPTVTVGVVVMVNPSVSRVLAEIESQAPAKLLLAVSPVDGCACHLGLASRFFNGHQLLSLCS